jgi:hypothetical protein
MTKNESLPVTLRVPLPEKFCSTVIQLTLGFVGILCDALLTL